MLPARRKKPRLAETDAIRREWPKHEKWVRGFECSVPGCGQGPIEFAHLRLGAKDNATGRKPPSWYGISLCQEHHRQAHQKGEMTFQLKHGIDWMKLAFEFARKSPDRAMKEEMRRAL